MHPQTNGGLAWGLAHGGLGRGLPARLPGVLGPCETIDPDRLAVANEYGFVDGRGVLADILPGGFWGRFLRFFHGPGAWFRFEPDVNIEKVQPCTTLDIMGFCERLLRRNKGNESSSSKLSNSEKGSTTVNTYEFRFSINDYSVHTQVKGKNLAAAEKKAAFIFAKMAYQDGYLRFRVRRVEEGAQMECAA